MPDSKIIIKSIRKRPQIKITRRHTNQNVKWRTFLLMLTFLGVLKKAH